MSGTLRLETKDLRRLGIIALFKETTVLKVIESLINKEFENLLIDEKVKAENLETLIINNYLRKKD